jgi:hypothetical protein
MADEIVVYHSANVILSKLLAGDAAYHPNILYVEFRKQYASVPPIDASDDKYYCNLANQPVGDATRDFLRIPVISVIPRTDSANPNNIVLEFSGICIGDRGVVGMPTHDTVIYGIGLGVSSTYGTGMDVRTQDIVWARGVFSEENQVPFSVNAQTAVTFKLKLSN